jgi:hypothetical protein
MATNKGCGHGPVCKLRQRINSPRITPGQNGDIHLFKDRLEQSFDRSG